MFLRSNGVATILVIAFGFVSAFSHGQALKLPTNTSPRIESRSSNSGHNDSTGDERSRLSAIAAQIRTADFEDDKIKLDELYETLAPFLQNESLAPSAHYWRGFALWRRALNGFNDSTSKEELDSNLSRASQEFAAAAAGRSGFVEATIGEVACEGTLVFLHHREPDQLQKHLQLDVALTKSLNETASDNPRFLWVLGGSLWNRPVAAGGSQTQAIETYHRGLTAITLEQDNPSDPIEPLWGKAELLMSLAWSSLHQATPDFDEADRYAHQALQIAPSWHFVRDILLPQIKDGRANGPKLSSASATPTVIQVRAMAGSVILYRDVSGSYEQHPTVFNELMSYAGKSYRATGPFFGIYPIDPDAVKGTALTWQVGIRVTSGEPGFPNAAPEPNITEVPNSERLRQTLASLHTPESPYKLAVLDEGEVAVIESTVGRAAADGLSVSPWMANNGYVQVGPTRMEYLSYSGPSEAIKVRILVPVKKRPSGLKLDDNR
ncbi:MAG: hypothetical protein ABR905_17310 [Terracidiphilus sp.]|jgi:hypothetical protein